jgi:phage terminase small subunit
MGHNQGKILAKRKLFVQEYMIDINATRAALRAGYGKGNEESARQVASRLMAMPEIKAAIQVEMDKRAKKIGFDAQTVLEELLKLATLDLSKAYGEDGKLLHPKQMPEEIRKAVSGIEVFEEFEGVGQNRQYIGNTVKVKFWDKVKSLELLGKHLKLFTEVVDLNDKTGIAQRLDRAKKRGK